MRCCAAGRRRGTCRGDDDKNRSVRASLFPPYTLPALLSPPSPSEAPSPSSPPRASPHEDDDGVFARLAATFAAPSGPDVRVQVHQKISHVRLGQRSFPAAPSRASAVVVAAAGRQQCQEEEDRAASERLGIRRPSLSVSNRVGPLLGDKLRPNTEQVKGLCPTKRTSPVLCVNFIGSFGVNTIGRTNLLWVTNQAKPRIHPI